MKKIVLLRHGESVWNKENRFTGWTDVDLTEKGVAEAEKAGETLREYGFNFDKAYTSYLKRAVKTLKAGGHLPVAAKQGRLCSTCGQPAHAHSGKGAHHQAQPAHGRHRAVRGIAVRLCAACRTLQLPQKRHHHIAERRSQHKTQHRRDDQGETNHFSISKFMPKGYSSASFCSA